MELADKPPTREKGSSRANLIAPRIDILGALPGTGPASLRYQVLACANGAESAPIRESPKNTAYLAQKIEC